LFFTKKIILFSISDYNLFNYSNIIPVAENLIRVMVLYVSFNGFILVLDGLLRGVGDTYWVMKITSIAYFVFILVETCLIRLFHVHYLLAFAIVVILMIFLFHMLFWRFKIGAWKKIHLIAN
jgi:Na+-driven multidrug efflux pump